MTEEDKKETILPENKEGETTIPLVTRGDKKAKEGSFMPLIIIMIASTIIAFYWDKLPWISDSIHIIFDPTAGALLNWNLNLGMIIIVFIITLLTTLVQKYATDQKTLKELRKEQKEMQKQMKEFKDSPEKLMELQKKQMAMFPRQMKLSMRAIAYTGIPFILFFRWFNDYFIANGNPKFILGMGWFLFYFIFTMLFSSLLRKYMDVV
jgi:uncharacterized membrane protein (DUF106 family)